MESTLEVCIYEYEQWQLALYMFKRAGRQWARDPARSWPGTSTAQPD
jgi:hypothetical protein